MRNRFAGMTGRPDTWPSELRLGVTLLLLAAAAAVIDTKEAASFFRHTLPEMLRDARRGAARR